MSGGTPNENWDRLISLSHLSAAVGHHVINAFSAVVSNAELLRIRLPELVDNSALDDLAAFAETIVQTSLSASTVARRLIDFTRYFAAAEQDQTRARMEPLDVNELLVEIVASQQPILGSGIRWQTRFSPVPAIRGDLEQLRMMWRHLILNAYEALPDRLGL